MPVTRGELDEMESLCEWIDPPATQLRRFIRDERTKNLSQQIDGFKNDSDAKIAEYGRFLEAFSAGKTEREFFTGLENEVRRTYG